jgi:hypothetical protein
VFYDVVDLRLLAAWGWIVGLLWLGGRFLNFRNRFLAHATKMVLPFYILQQTVIIIVAYFVVQTGLAVPFKFGIIAAVSLAVIVAAYELVVSRIGPIGFLFGKGMWKKTTAPEWRRAGAGVALRLDQSSPAEVRETLRLIASSRRRLFASMLS